MYYVAPGFFVVAVALLANGCPLGAASFFLSGVVFVAADTVCHTLNRIHGRYNCPRCGGAIRPDSELCRHCSAALTWKLLYDMPRTWRVTTGENSEPRGEDGLGAIDLAKHGWGIGD